jgi:hypothetical protein
MAVAQGTTGIKVGGGSMVTDTSGGIKIAKTDAAGAAADATRRTRMMTMTMTMTITTAAVTTAAIVEAVVMEMLIVEAMVMEADMAADMMMMKMNKNSKNIDLIC